ncbi:MAG: inositol phosphorylceramide synthase [Nocardioides sp.]|nr:inositol phosphorylceramide synthase [Nocardioides sp.]
MHRRAYVTLIGVAGVMGALAVTVSVIYDRPLLDPEGSFLGPTWLRLPLLLLGALLLDLLPRTLWYSRLKPSAMPPLVRERLRTHWSRERLTLVALGVICFYITYVSYRNLKSALPFVRDFTDDSQMFDRELFAVDRVLFFGHEPGPFLHDLLGTHVAAWGLSYIYLWFLPLVPLALTAWLVWSRNISFGYWFATSQAIAWSLGTLSYYLLPTLGPVFYFNAGYSDLAHTPTTDLIASLKRSREAVLYGDYNGVEVLGTVNSVAGFASLHVAITLLVALMVQFTLRNKVIKVVFWVNFGLTVVATLYFGWHYVADDIAGVMIAFTAFYLGGVATGQRFDRYGTSTHPTTTTSKVPVDVD